MLLGQLRKSDVISASGSLEQRIRNRNAPRTRLSLLAEFFCFLKSLLELFSVFLRGYASIFFPCVASERGIRKKSLLSLRSRGLLQKWCCPLYFYIFVILYSVAKICSDSSLPRGERS